nr:protein Turandot M-like [Drosophila kikkawai]
MNPPISLSCLVVVIGSLVWTSGAQPDFETDRKSVIEVFKGTDSGSIGDSQVLFLVEFLAKYIDEIELTIEQRSEANFIVRQYNRRRAKKPLGEGVPAQGGWLTQLERHIVVQLGIDLASKGVIKEARS